ncbi:hypothetical protein HYH03_006863 [Edaphochlamys debaryana]|uniref:RING-type E3 ubiquitin transferase n=1 Tax=Edaphochlamys debaryana TaxID=47281 RepID=A0A835Y2W9_9CHLO|nr:hypothetical protein HYH03_006863 [Edaphochlamys debaryana]|eukprot:KAG2494928.1 hypothetical protein HYH03_006863 [Edaphochlamys debaryana]
MTPSYVLDPLPDIPADFGPDIPDAGIDGYLRSADPEDACDPFTFSDFDTPWIALIARQQQLHFTNCTFDVKIQNAQAAGAIAAIVYDDVYESLIIMSKPKGHPDPDIPSVFVSQKAGIIMKKLMTLDVIRVRITPLSSVAWLSMLMSAFLGLLSLGVVLATFYVMRSWSMWITGMHHRVVTTGAGTAAGGAAGGQPTGPGGRPTPQDLGLAADALRRLPVLVFDPSTRASRQQSAAPSGLASAAHSLPGSQSQSQCRLTGIGASSLAAAAATAAVWAEEVEEEEEGVGSRGEMRALLPRRRRPTGGDVEAGCGAEEAGEELEGEEEEVVSRSSSESGHTCAALLSGGTPLPKAPGAHAGETKRLCAICLESYEEGEKIRVLPCAHRFHMTCVDQWLSNRRFCPLCKHDASQPLPQALAGGGAGGAGSGPGGRAAAGAQPVNGWALLMQSFVDLLRHPHGTGGTRAGAGAGAGPAQAPRQAAAQAPRGRARRTGQRQRAPELAEPLMARVVDVEAPTPAPGPSLPAAPIAIPAPAGAAPSTAYPVTPPRPGTPAVPAAAAVEVTAPAQAQAPATQAAVVQLPGVQPAEVQPTPAGPAARARALLSSLFGNRL